METGSSGEVGDFGKHSGALQLCLSGPVPQAGLAFKVLSPHAAQAPTSS